MWFTGRPASGKSTLARDVAAALNETGTRAVILDSDEIRDAIVPDFGYGDEGRDHFYESLANLAALFARQSHVVLVAATANLARFRQRAFERTPSFLEVYVATDAAECAARDPKGLYARAAADRASNLPGVGAIYEEPEAPDVVAPIGTSEAAVAEIVSRIAKRQ